MEEFSQEWFELRDLRKRLFSRAVWIPVYGSILPIERGKYPELGHVEEVLAVGSAVVFNSKREKAEGLDWHYWSLDNTTPYLKDDGQYLEAESFYDDPDGRLGLRLVLTQYLNSSHQRQIFINQDFILAYGLLEEGDYWVRPNEGYEQVIRLTRKGDGTVSFVEIRAEYLKDYLAARDAALRLYYYRQRRAVIQDNPNFDWPEDFSLVSEPNDRLEVRCNEIDASGDFPGTTWAVFTAWRTDVDPEEEVPDFSGNDDEATETATRKGVRGDEGGRFHVCGEMWRGEWIEPAAKSCLIGYGEPDETLMVRLDGGGGRVDLKTLNREEVGKYLWFQPSVVNDLLSRRGATMKWYTRDTGGVSPSPDWLLHFGVNKLGLINAYAYDIARRPLWERRIWVAHNCRPDGGVSAELMQAQMACKPAGTKSPEFLLHSAISWLDGVFQQKFEAMLLRDHHEVEELEGRIHRFRGVDENGLRSLAKDVVKATIERINKTNLLRALGEGKTDQGTLKLLQKLLAKYTEESYAYKRMTPLFGVYDLRGADAHLSSSDIEECYSRLGVDRSAPLIQQAAQLIENVAEAFGVTGGDLRRHAPDP
ncbi:MAG: hypothetical protein U0934_00475 [Pseudotabrizicola sp.]|uniref:hypothetical protein n=1 Tax=Pseudotabrizicola sp. TaxID=2939647 RepID=UPI002731C34C|nr:hypothetical protein [Pseudotabrizicola sp.]MDP2082999.1 hypothetical protein [Pseudotabrizicola sp.]MDZ7572417.1 hypothetical protein [Pseudotabrizicola sp.]